MPPESARDVEAGLRAGSSGGVHLEPFAPHHLDGFLALAAAEGWVCDRWEFDFLLSTFPEGCRVACMGQTPAGYITAIGYGAGGWVGNLIVREEFRGMAIGTRLMEEVLKVLDGAGTRTVWLTASPSGKAIYERLGFVAIDRIVRWRGRGRGGEAASLTIGGEIGAIHLHDAGGWGDGRFSLVAAAAARGVVIREGEGFIVVQRTGGTVQLGPWSASSVECGVRLLHRALATVERGTGVVLDSPAGNRGAAAILEGYGFERTGMTDLMFRGRVPVYLPDRVYALATMGSIG